jgi:hypothetical protein
MGPHPPSLREFIMKGLPVRGARAATNKANKAKGNPFGKPEAKEMMMGGKMGKKVEVPKRKKMG